jgi:hypothetical protein
MSQSLDPAAHVYEGFWIDWTKGSTHGLTLTLCPTSATLLIATLALFVKMSGGQLWTIVRFILHQAHASPGPQLLSMLQNQRLVVLRNATTDLSTARLLFCLAWSWRNNAVKSFSSSMVIILIAISHAVFFIVAGTFSSTVANAGESVLSRSSYCGVWNETYLEIAGNGINISTDHTLALSLEFIAKKYHDVQLSLEYARDCYMSPVSYSSCNTFQRPRLNWTIPTNVSCPFEPATCSENSETITFDTGPIDSHSDLGINAHDQDILLYRRVTSCTVLNDTAYTTNWVNQTDDTGIEPSLKTAYANFGPSLLYKTPWTYEYSNFASFYTNFTGATTTPYQVDAQLAFGESPNPSSSTFVPVPELKQSQADLTLVFLSFTGRYLTQIDDPWFSAHQPYLANSNAAIPGRTFMRDRPVSTLGCTEKHQLNTSSGMSTPLLGFDQVQDFVSSHLNLTANQMVILDRLMRSATASSMKRVVEGLAVSSTPMLAINSAVSESSTLSVAIPSYQWQLEAKYWHSVAMALFQRTFVEYGTGQVAAQPAYILPPPTASDRWFCENLMIRGTAYQSFSVIALILIVGIGSFIILVSLNIESLAGAIQTRLGRGLAGRDMWEDHDMLGLQHWRREFEQVPPSRSGSGPVKQACYQAQNHKSGRTDCTSIVAPPRCSKPAPTPPPDPGRLLHAVSIASYREGFMARSQGSWI